MAILIETLPPQTKPKGRVEHVSLPFHDRTKARIKTTTDAGTEIALALPRGTTLADGMLLYNSAERSIVMKAEPEEVLAVMPANQLDACTIAHHIGNWHRGLQVCESGEILIEFDTPIEEWLHQRNFKYKKVTRAYHPNLRTGTSHSH